MEGDCSDPLVCESDLEHLQGHLHVYYLNIMKLFKMENINLRLLFDFSRGFCYFLFLQCRMMNWKSIR